MGSLIDPGRPLGVVMLDHNLVRPPGDVGNPETFPFPVMHKIVHGVSLERLLNADPAILEQLIQAGRELEQAGAWGLASGCGFFVIFQAQTAAALKIPVFLSSLIQVPLVQAIIGPDQAVGVLTAHSGRLTEAHLKAAGADPATTVVVGLEGEPAFVEGVLTDGGAYERAAMEKEIIARAKVLAKETANGLPVGALVFECTNLPPFAEAVQAAVNLPVFDSTTLVESAYRAKFRRNF